jgi:hypothetical protein
LRFDLSANRNAALSHSRFDRLVWLAVGVSGLLLSLTGVVLIPNPETRILYPAIIAAGALAALLGYFVQVRRTWVYPTMLEVDDLGVTLTFLPKNSRLSFRWDSPDLELAVGDCYGATRLAKLGPDERYFLYRGQTIVGVIPASAFEAVLAMAKQRGVSILQSEADSGDDFLKERRFSFRPARGQVGRHG